MPPGDGFLVSFPLKQFFSADPLGILPVADLQPGCAWQVGIESSLRNHTFEVSLADKMEQLFTHARNARRRLLDVLIRGEQPEKCGLPSSSRSYVMAELLALELLGENVLSEQSHNRLTQARIL